MIAFIGYWILLSLGCGGALWAAALWREHRETRRAARLHGRSKVQVGRLFRVSQDQVKPEHIRKVGGF